MKNEPKKKKAPEKRAPKKRQHEAVAGFSRFLHAMNLMLEAASRKSEHGLTRHETLLLSIFKNGIISREKFQREFRKLLVAQRDDDAVDVVFDNAFTGLAAKNLIRPAGESVEITDAGHGELKRLSEQVDAVYDQLVKTLPRSEREAVIKLMRKMGSK